jgi:hypothetical protein
MRPVLPLLVKAVYAVHSPAGGNASQITQPQLAHQTTRAAPCCPYLATLRPGWWIAQAMMGNLYILYKQPSKMLLAGMRGTWKQQACNSPVPTEPGWPHRLIHRREHWQLHMPLLLIPSHPSSVSSSPIGCSGTPETVDTPTAQLHHI